MKEKVFQNKTSWSFKNNKTKRIPDNSSTVGYCQEILLRQPEHLPRKPRKLKTGINSYQVNFLAQFIQALRPPSDLEVFKRKITTLRNDPTISPKEKKIKDTINIIINYTSAW